MKNKIEILAPAGGFDSVVAAVNSGADAVYIGSKSFSARASAHNFDDEELRECVRFCHRRGVKVHLALNTLIFDEEMPAALQLVKNAAKADIDALIIQDLGLVSLVKRMVPDLPLHASTQLTVHTPYGAKALYEMGFKRVVLSRELSLQEIKRIREACPEVELEVFVHGALCMCLSGQCYFSAMLGGRSANRGMCAQPCRLPMKFGSNDHALSLKDNGSLDHLRQLQAMGIASAKIEGRMKRPEYVAAATLAAREARDLGFITEDTGEKLRSVFSRTGFTDGYLRGELGRDMFGYRRKNDVISADSKLLKDIRSGCRKEYPRIPVSFDLTVKTGEKPTLSAADGQNTVTVTGDSTVEKAEKISLTPERTVQSLSKLGSTPYYIGKINTQISPDASIPASALNALRREALEQLDQKREIIHNYTIHDIDLSSVLTGGERIHNQRYAVVNSLPLPDSMRDIDRIFVDVFGLSDDNEVKKAMDSGFRLGAEVPRATFDNEDEIEKRLVELKKLGITHLTAHNIAAVYIGKKLGFTVHAGFGMNIANSYTLRWAKDYGIADAVLSIELDEKRINAMRKCISVGIIRYGHLPLMLCRNHPAGAEPCKKIEFLQDRKDERFPVIRRVGYSEIMNCVPLLMPQKDYDFNNKVFSVFIFSVENSVDNMEKTMRKLSQNLDFERKTHGLYIRGVKNLTIF